MSVLEVSWPDGSFITRVLQPAEMKSVVEVAYPRDAELSTLANDTEVDVILFNSLCLSFKCKYCTISFSFPVWSRLYCEEWPL